MTNDRRPRLEFVVLGKPQPKQRARKGRGGHWYTPSKTVRFEADVKMMAMVAVRDQCPAWPVDATYQVHVIACHPNPGVDVDNIAKSVLDGLNKTLWKDDRQVHKLISERGSMVVGPQTAVVIEALS